MTMLVWMEDWALLFQDSAQLQSLTSELEAAAVAVPSSALPRRRQRLLQASAICKALPDGSDSSGDEGSKTKAP